MTYKKSYKDKEVYGLLKLPDGILFQQAQIEIGKLKSYIQELEDKIKEYQLSDNNKIIESLRQSVTSLRKQNKNLKNKIRPN